MRLSVYDETPVMLYAFSLESMALFEMELLIESASDLSTATLYALGLEQMVLFEQSMNTASDSKCGRCS